LWDLGEKNLRKEVDIEGIKEQITNKDEILRGAKCIGSR
jgi:hypothetical protein